MAVVDKISETLFWVQFCVTEPQQNLLQVGFGGPKSKVLRKCLSFFPSHNSCHTSDVLTTLCVLGC